MADDIIYVYNVIVRAWRKRYGAAAQPAALPRERSAATPSAPPTWAPLYPRRA